MPYSTHVSHYVPHYYHRDKYRIIPGAFCLKHIKYCMAHPTTMSSSNCIEINVVLVTMHSITLRDYFNSSELLD